MNPIRRFLIKLRLLPITPADLTVLLDQANDARLSTQARLRAWVEYAVFTQSPEQLSMLLDYVAEALIEPSHSRPGSAQ